MPKYTATITGYLKFKREIHVFADNEDNAGLVAEEMINHSMTDVDDEIALDGIYIKPYVGSDKTFEIIAREKVND